MLTFTNLRNCGSRLETEKFFGKFFRPAILLSAPKEKKIIQPLRGKNRNLI
jgi:hypothetical protein